MPKPFPAIFNVSEARAAFSDILKKAEAGEVFIARHGKPVAAVLSAERYQELIQTLELLEEELLTERAKARMKRIEAGNETTLTFEEVFGEAQ